MTVLDPRDIALGTMYFGTRIDEARAFELLDRFVLRGGRWLDTANNYAFWLDPSGLGGASESVIGSWLRANPGLRDRVRISTKVGAAPTVPGDWPGSMEGLGATAVRTAFEGSLERLGTDHVDLLWAHVEDREIDLEEQVSVFGSLAAEGKAMRLGASNHAGWRVERARSMALTVGVEPFTAVQLRHSYLQPSPFVPLPDRGHVVATPEALDHVLSTDLRLWVYNVLLGGAYADQARLQDAYRHPSSERRLAALDRVAAMLGATRNQVVLSWLLGSPQSPTPIVGVSTLEQLDEMMDARQLQLDEEARGILEEVVESDDVHDAGSGGSHGALS
ncbi:aldo/keto reductase [Arthrobacter sp. Y-9]|uniref:aldo/keto reductase n=1 Tax=Arthrobacter sp. Y-9 TaxID=3039385 RepID=UPI00241C4851|nr:aldo/keto reductase [Arthrobacter sp. Y-9]WFR84566.1 aldo/keto reductase [Arthrobacter sp. Y-9]